MDHVTLAVCKQSKRAISEMRLSDRATKVVMPDIATHPSYKGTLRHRTIAAPCGALTEARNSAPEPANAMPPDDGILVHKEAAMSRLCLDWPRELLLAVHAAIHLHRQVGPTRIQTNKAVQ